MAQEELVDRHNKLLEINMRNERRVTELENIIRNFIRATEVQYPSLFGYSLFSVETCPDLLMESVTTRLVNENIERREKEKVRKIIQEVLQEKKGRKKSSQEKKA